MHLDTPKDNKCLFHALARWGGGTANNMREALCWQILDNPGRYVHMCGLEREEDVACYVENMALEALCGQFFCLGAVNRKTLGTQTFWDSRNTSQEVKQQQMEHQCPTTR